MFVLIGGGDLKTKSTKEIDDFIISMTNKKFPNILFIPTASFDSVKAISNFKCSYEKRGNIKVLDLFSNIKYDIKALIEEADIIYISGGDTIKLIKKWNEYDLANLIFKKRNEKIIAGISAGAICWFEKYLGDSEAFFDNGFCNFKVYNGFGLLKGIICPHYDEDGKDVFNSIMKKTDLFGYALENNTALVLDGNFKKIVKSNKKSSVYEFEPFNNIMREMK